MDGKHGGDEHEHPSLVQSALYLPFTILFYVLRRLRDSLRPYRTQLIPLLAFILCIPVAFFLSSVAGWVIWRSIAVSWEAPVYFQFGDAVQPHALTELPKLVPQQPYHVALHLTVPASQANYDLGNFMTTLTVLTPNNRTLITISRPAIVVPPISWPFFGSPKTVDIPISLLESFIPGTTSLLASLRIGRGDGWKSIGNGQGRELSVLRATIRGVVAHHGIRGLITRFPLIFSVISSFLFMTILVLLLAACVIPVAFESAPERPIKSEPDTITDPAFEAGESKPPKGKRRSLGRRPSSQIAVAIKTEELEGIVTPPSEALSNPLRRRRSRQIDNSDSD